MLARSTAMGRGTTADTVVGVAYHPLLCDVLDAGWAPAARIRLLDLPQTVRLLAPHAARAACAGPCPVPGCRRRTWLHRTHPQRIRVAGHRSAPHSDRETTGCAHQQRL